MRPSRACLLAVCLFLLAVPSAASAQADYLVAAGTATAVSPTCNPGTTHTFALVGEELTSGSGVWNFRVVQDGGLESVTETGGSICELGVQGSFLGAWNPVVGGCIPGTVPVLMCLNVTLLLAPHVAVYNFHYEYFDGRPTWDGTATLAYL